MSAVLVLWLMCGFLVDLPTTFSRPPWLPEEYGSGIEADESAKRQSGGCGIVDYVNNTLKSPGYPFNYPNYMDCVYWVPIPTGMAMRIDFVTFNVESHSFCNWDYLKITNDQNQTIGQYCGVKDGFHVIVTGDYVVLKFHSDGSVTKPGYLLSFNAFSNGTQSPPTTLPTTPPTTLPTTPPTVGCGSFNYANNTLKSPGYPNNYQNNMDCEYWVSIPQGMAMRIDFVTFSLESNSFCSYDYLKITNDQNQTFGQYCGFKDGFHVIVTGGYVLLKFHSDGSVTAFGYLLSFNAFSNGTQSPPTTLPTAPPTADPCGYVQNNTLLSPGYPSYYPNNMDCSYWVYIPYGKDLQIYFYFFEVNDCGYDYLKISNEQNQTFGSFCGYKSGHYLVVSGQYAVLTFHSDGIYTDDGYKLFFSFVSQGIASTSAPYTTSPYQTAPTPTPNVTGCGYVHNNQLTSPGYPGYYPHNMDCNYYIYMLPGKALKVDFQYFGISDCWFDYVKIINDQGQTFGTFCGNKTGEVVYVTGYYAVVTFHSDGIINGPGYKLVFSQVSQANVSTSAPWPPSTTYPPYTTPNKPFPSYYPSMDPKCKLQTYIRILEIVLNEMENVVDYELGSKFSAREYKVRVKRALSNVQAAKNMGGRQKRDVREVRKIEELENRAAELMKKLDTKEAQSKMRALLNRKMAETRAENAPIKAY